MSKSDDALTALEGFQRPLQPISRSPEIAGREIALPDAVCPVCGTAVTPVKCKVVCAKCGHIVMNCSEF